MPGPIKTFPAPHELFPLRGDISMPPYITDSLLKRCVECNGLTEQLSVPVVRVGNTLRPSVFGALGGTEILEGDVDIQVFPHLSVSVKLLFENDAAETVGLPVSGFNGSKFTGAFGDTYSAEQGYESLEAVIRTTDGAAALIARRTGGDSRELMGLSDTDINYFASGCIIGVRNHRENLAKKNAAA